MIDAQLMFPIGMMVQAVIGAGAAGLAAARELVREGHVVTVLEQTDRIGGVWAYTDAVEDDPLGLDPHRQRVHSSMYEGLRTNLPREVMGYSEFPFDTKFTGSNDPRRFCSHQEVLAYLEAFAGEFELLQHIRFRTHVCSLVPTTPTPATTRETNSGGNDEDGWPRWNVTLQTNNLEQGSQPETLLFDAVMVCNGHYTEPRVPFFPGQNEFPGLQMHSHNYRRPRPAFIGKRIVIIGAAFSGTDIAQELVDGGAAGVWLSSRSQPPAAHPENGDEYSGMMENGSTGHLHRVGNVKALLSNGSVVFEDGSVVERVDVVMYATGYLYKFPFLENSVVSVNVDDNCVAPLYKHIFHPSWAPTLSFIGLPWKVVPFPQFELQSRWVARCLSGRVKLPLRSAMEAEVLAFHDALEEEGIPKRYAHRMQGDIQTQYNLWLERACRGEVNESLQKDDSIDSSTKCKSVWPEWRQALYKACGECRRVHGVHFRDVPLPHEAQEALLVAKIEADKLRSTVS